MANPPGKRNAAAPRSTRTVALMPGRLVAGALALCTLVGCGEAYRSLTSGPVGRALKQEVRDRGADRVVHESRRERLDAEDRRRASASLPENLSPKASLGSK